MRYVKKALQWFYYRYCELGRSGSIIEKHIRSSTAPRAKHQHSDLLNRLQTMNQSHNPGLANMFSSSTRIKFHLRLALVLCFVWPLLLVAADVEDYLRDARAYVDKGEYSAAVIQLKNALLVEPDNAEARLLLGQTYLELKDALSAEKELLRAQDLGVTREAVLVPLGHAWLMSGQHDKVLQGITQETGDSPELVIDILVLQGQAYLVTRNLAMAGEKFTNALALQPDATEALLGQARIDYQNQDTAAATGLIDKALSLEPDNTDALILKGELLRSAGKPQEAAAAFQKAMEIDPGNLPARLGNATALIAFGETDTALVDIDYVLGKHPDLFLANYLKALTQFQQQQREPAQESVQRALKQAPGHLPSHLLAGTLAYQQGQYNQAEQHLRTYWNGAPDNQQATMLLAATLMKLKQPGKAIQVLEPGASSARGNAQYLALLGSAYLAHGETAKGLEYLEQAAETAPEVASIRTQLAIGQLMQGDVDEASSELESAVDLGQDLMQADVLLIMTYLKRKEFDKALASAESVAGKMPESPLPLNLIGAAQLGMNDLPAARQAFEAALRIEPEFLPTYFNLAQLDLLDGDSAAAEARYQEVLTHDANNLKALLALAALAHRSGQVDETAQWLKQAHEHHPEAIQPGLLLVEHYQRQHDPLRALDKARESAVTHPRHPTVLQVLAGAQLNAGKDKEALGTLRTQVEVTPQSPQAHYQLARVQLKLKATEAARNSLQQAITLQPDYPAAQVALGRLGIVDKDYDAALSLANDLQKTYPDAAYGHELTGDVHAARGEHTQATDAYAQASSKGSSAQLARKLYHSRSQTGETELAQTALRQWLDEHPEDIPIRSLLAQAQLGAGRQAQAIEEYLKVLEYDPENVTALNNIAWLYQEQGNFSEGVKYAERTHMLVPDRPEVTDTLGWLLVQNGDTNRGLVLLQEARIKAPHIPDIHYHMAVALYKSGRTGEARKELERLLKTNKTFPEIDKARALVRQLGN